MRTPNAVLATIFPTAALFAATLSGCASGPIAGPVAPDGDVREWRGPAAAAADSEYLYARFSLGETPIAPQNTTRSTRVAFDLDNDPATGKPLAMSSDGPQGFQDLGIELEVIFSPPNDARPGPVPTRSTPAGDDELRGGVTVVTYSDTGAATVHRHADAALVSGPTHASTWFELRLARLSPALEGTPAADAGPAAVVTFQTSPMARIADPAFRHITGFGSPETFTKPAASPVALASDEIPSSPDGAIRVLGYNVWRARLLDNPEPFARVITGLAPDVILFQEASDMTAADIEAWLNENAPGDGDWSAASNPDTGIALATPHGIEFPLVPAITRQNERGEDRTVRIAGAVISTPEGELFAASLHLKCCGDATGAEENARILEAALFTDWMNETLDNISSKDGGPIMTRVIGGDINLVGTRRPLTDLMAGVAVGGGDLVPAQTSVLGDVAEYTWRADRSSFGPGRLDWIATDTGTAEIVNAFALDTRLLTETTLEAAGLMPEDSAASDHLPVVVDIMPK